MNKELNSRTFIGSVTSENSRQLDSEELKTDNQHKQERRGQRRSSDIEAEIARLKERNEGVLMLDLNFFKT